MSAAPPPALRLEPVDLGGRSAGQYDRVWLFLDYGAAEHRNLRLRWAIGARGEDGLWLFAPVGAADTFEDALDLIPAEVELAKEAVRRIRAGEA